MANTHRKRWPANALLLTGVWAVVAWAVLGCAGILGLKDTSFKDKAASLEAQSIFYATLLPTIEPAGGREPTGTAVVLAPTYAATLNAVAADAKLGQEDREYAARGIVNECHLLTDVLRKRRLFGAVSFQEAESPPDAAPGLAEKSDAVIYLDLQERAWFFLPRNGGAADRLNLGMYVAHSHGDVRAWLAKIEEDMARPPLAKAPAPPPPPPPAEPPKRALKAPKAAPRDLQPAPFGLRWRANLADLRRLKCKLGPPRKTGDLVEYVVEQTPEYPENTGKMVLTLHKAFGLQKIVWQGAAISGDPYGFLGREQFLKLQNLLEERYGPPGNVDKFLDEKQFKARDQFYACLGQAGCGKWAVSWKLPGMAVRLELVPVQDSAGGLLLTYQGPDWEKILAERKRLEQQKLQKAI